MAGVAVAGAVGVLGVLAAPALGAARTPPGLVLAQQSGAVPPKPGKADDPPVIVTYGVMLILAAGIIGANMIPSKRGHQD